MKTLKYVIKRLLIAVVILLGVSVIIFGLSRMMPTDYFDEKYMTQLQHGQISQEEVDRIKDIYGMLMPEAYLTVNAPEGSKFAGESFRKNEKLKDKEGIDELLNSPDITDKAQVYADWYAGSSFDSKGKSSLRLYLNANGSYEIYRITSSALQVVGDDAPSEGEEDNNNHEFVMVEELVIEEEGMYTVEVEYDKNGKPVRGDLNVTFGTFSRISDKGKVPLDISTFRANGLFARFTVVYREANFWNKAGAIFKSYFNWLGNMLKGDMGISFKYGEPVGKVIVQNMGISFVISFIATILQFVIAIPLGIKAATNQYGVVDYTVTIFAMMGISLPTFFLANLFIRVFAVGLGWFPVGSLVSGSLSVDASWFQRLMNQAWHLVLPMTVLVILSIGGLMRYTRTNTLEVLNADYIRTARAKGASERAVVYKHAFRNTMIPLVTMLAGILPSLFSGAMITETVFSIPGIGKLAYDALVAKDIPFIMGYNMFMAILTVLGTLFSDLMYAVVDPRVKLGG